MGALPAGRLDDSPFPQWASRGGGPLPGMRYNSHSMKRLFRLLLIAATVLSLVLCVATVVLWVRSYRVAQSGGQTRPSGGACCRWQACSDLNTAPMGKASSAERT
jgi:hypothetical protein